MNEAISMLPVWKRNVTLLLLGGLGAGCFAISAAMPVGAAFQPQWAEETPSASVVQNKAPWGLDRIDQRNLPLSNSYSYQQAAPRVHVYVLDTGVRTSHSEFEGRATNDFDATGGDGEDCNGGGTHVAGVIGGKTYGVAKKARIHSVRTLGCDEAGTVAALIAGVEWVTTHHEKPAVVHIREFAFGDALLDAAIQELIDAGVVVVVSSGNNGQDACNYSPARVPEAITVGATTINDERTNSSNWGRCLDIFAPGQAIKSAWWTSDSKVATKENWTGAPFVAGVAALYLSQNPDATPAQVAKAILQNATPNLIQDPGLRSPNLLVYSLFKAPNAIPVPKSPVGKIKDNTPTFKWTRVQNSTHYQIQLRNNHRNVYIKISPQANCGSSMCVLTPSIKLANSTYMWRVRARVGGVWGSWSSFSTFVLNK